MGGQFLITLGNASQIDEAFNGPFLKGRREPRIAMVGRSNVGKSSLINALLETRLAQTSAEPGKTRLLHFYVWTEAKRIIADLPGYGFAKASKEDREKWSKLIEKYMSTDEGLTLVLLLVDARVGPTDLDLQALDYLISLGVQIHLVFTKADGLKTQSQRAARKKDVTQILEKLGYNHLQTSWVSGKEKDLGFKKLKSKLKELGKEKLGAV